MKKSSKIAVVALILSMVGIIISVLAFLKRKSCALCDDMDDDFIDYYDDEDECLCDECECENCTCEQTEETEEEVKEEVKAEQVEEAEEQEEQEETK